MLIERLQFRDRVQPIAQPCPTTAADVDQNLSHSDRSVQTSKRIGSPVTVTLGSQHYVGYRQRAFDIEKLLSGTKFRADSNLARKSLR